MALRKLRDTDSDNVRGYALTVSTSGNNPIIDATDQADSTPFVGATNRLRVHAASVTNTSATETVARIVATGGDSAVVGDTRRRRRAGLCPASAELPLGEGLSINLSGANTHYVVVQYAGAGG